MVRRALDVFAAFIGLILLAPLFCVISVLIRATSPGPVFHRSRRVGQGGGLFRLYKFRSMRLDAEKAGPGITAAGDPRITPIGSWLRRTKIDELPQLINVLRGDMSLVGPRPEDPRYVAFYTAEQRRVLECRPGITSAASVRYRNEEEVLAGPDWEKKYLEVVLPDKLRIELDYRARRSLYSDGVVLLKTFWELFR